MSSGGEILGNVISSVVTTLTATLTGAVAAWYVGQRRKAKTIRKVWGELERPEFTHYFQQHALTAASVTVIGTGLAALMNDPFRRALEDRAATGKCQLEIYLADPISPSVEDRLTEEELQLGKGKPKVGQMGLKRFLGTILDEREKCRSADRPEPFKVKLFSHYPTFALMIVDDKYFFYPYGYALLGNFSPVFELWRDRSDPRVITFLEEHYKRVKASAVDAATLLKVRNENIVPADANLHSVAVFFVPLANTSLYQFGSHVLGYDVRAQMPAGPGNRSPWDQQVGPAREFGFHLTVCDALYFLSDTAVDLIIADLELLARQLEPFDLVRLDLKERYPDASAIALTAEAPSGELEILHNELVHSAYRRAVASNYSLGRTGVERDADTDRTELMIKRYFAPYIMQRFKPHFTLLSGVTPEIQTELADQLRKEWTRRNIASSVRVDRLAVMTKPVKSNHWEIKTEVKLGGD